MMELLVRKPGTVRPTHDEGDVFAVYPDGAIPTAPAPGSVFWLIRVPGMDLKHGASLLEPAEETVLTLRPTLTHRRRRHIDWAMIPDRDALERDRMVTLTPAQWAAVVVRDKLR